MVRVDFPFFTRVAASGGSFYLFFLLRMFGFFRFPALSGLLLSASLLLSSPVAHAQTTVPAGAVAAHGYDFLTVTTTEGLNKKLAQLIFTPAFQNQTIVPLLPGNILASSSEEAERLSHNTLIINNQLSNLTVAGWELVQVYSVSPISGAGYNPPVTRYLFRKAKN
jgi:hypothetical protein